MLTKRLMLRRGHPRVSPWKRARVSTFVNSVVEVGLVVDVIDIVGVEEVGDERTGDAGAV